MMQSGNFQPSWPFFNVINQNLDNQVGFFGLDMDGHVDATSCEFSPSFINPDEVSEISSIPFSSTMFSSEFEQSPGSDDVFQVMEDYLLDLEGYNLDFSNEMECFYGQFSESDGEFVVSNARETMWSPSSSIKSSETSMETSQISSSSSPSLTLPGEDVDNQLGVFHLLKAYGEAMERGEKELADVIMRCLSEKVSPAGETLERLAFNLSQDPEKHGGDYLKQESCKNIEAAFRAFYLIFPHGKFPHFAANSAILEAIPADAEAIHMVDFDIGEGIQWPPLIEALAKSHNKVVRLTAIKWEKEEGCEWWSFEEAKRRLINHAKGFGLKLKVDEMGIEELVSEIKRAKKRGGRKEWLAFNCMVGLPHMGRVRNRRNVEKFLRVSQDLVSNSAWNSGAGNRGGIITFGDGDAWENLRGCSGFGAFFDGNLVHYQALLDSIQTHFPAHLGEARMAMECLFVAPYISSQAWFQKWMEMREGCNLQMGTGGEVEGWRISRENLEEARELVGEKLNSNSYEVRVGGKWKNEMILEWKGHPLVRISTWRI